MRTIICLTILMIVASLTTGCAYQGFEYIATKNSDGTLRSRPHYSPPRQSMDHARPNPNTPQTQWQGVKPIPNGFSVSLKEQTMCFFKEHKAVRCAHISSGAPGYETVTGDFRIRHKSPMVLSYKYRNALGEPSEMPWSLCFHGSYCTHAGHLPGYPASHGCIRTEPDVAKVFFNLGELGTRFLVY